MLLDTKLCAGSISRHVVAGTWDFNKLTGNWGYRMVSGSLSVLVHLPLHSLECLHWFLENGAMGIPHKSVPMSCFMPLEPWFSTCGSSPLGGGGGVRQLFHRGHLRPLENTGIHYDS